MESHYKSNKNEATDFAIRYFVRTIHSLSKLDECDVSFIKTKRFLETGYIDGMSFHDLRVIDNLKSTFSLIIDNNDILNCDINSLLEFNKILGKDIINNCGKIRKSYVYTDNLSIQLSIAPLSDEILIEKLEFYKNLVSNIAKTKEEKCTYIFSLGAYIIKNQPFVDGNKRTAFMMMNLMLIKENIGLILLNEEIMYSEFQNVLEKLFVQEDEEDFIKLLKENILIVKINN